MGGITVPSKSKTLSPNIFALRVAYHKPGAPAPWWAHSAYPPKR